jgi:CBS domain containing-hemolysin-like protein
MSTVILALVLLTLAMAGVVIRKTYYHLPLHELKRQAENRDSLAERLYRAAAYGESLRGLLWIFIATTSACGFVLLARVTPLWVSAVTVAVLLWISYSWLPASRVSRFGAKLTALVTPLIAWLLNYLHPVLSKSVRVANKRHAVVKHTGLFERSDLIDLLELQQSQADSRLSDEEIEIIKRALSFSDHKVGEILIPRKKLKTVLAKDTVGPILIDELHKTGQQFALVKDTPKGTIVGSIDIKDMGLHSSGLVSDHMSTKIYYVHEADSLTEVLHAFYQTNQPFFVVVNNFEEYLGIVSIENILQKLLGHIPGEDFDQYSDISAVAARHSKAEPDKSADESDENPEEVVE